MYIYGEKLQGPVEKINSNLVLYLALAILTGLVIYLYTEEPEDTTVNDQVIEYKLAIDSMQRSAAYEKKRIDSLIIERDSTLAALSIKEKEDKEVIHEKFDKKRSDILILSDDESVELLSKNLGGI